MNIVELLQLDNKQLLINETIYLTNISLGKL